MELAAIILSTISLVLSIASISWLIGKQLSSHQITYIDPMQNMIEQMSGKKGKNPLDEFAEIGDKPFEDIGDDK